MPLPYGFSPAATCPHHSECPPEWRSAERGLHGDSQGFGNSLEFSLYPTYADRGTIVSTCRRRWRYVEKTRVATWL
jgi:hypothetical protein